MGHKPKNKDKDNKPANAWLTGHPNDEFDRQQFMRTFSGVPSRSRICSGTSCVRSTRAVPPSQRHVLHAAVGATAAETYAASARSSRTAAPGREVWDAMVALARANALLLARASGADPEPAHGASSRVREVGGNYMGSWPRSRDLGRDRTRAVARRRPSAGRLVRGSGRHNHNRKGTST
jgi:hypothetical protein